MRKRVERGKWSCVVKEARAWPADPSVPTYLAQIASVAKRPSPQTFLQKPMATV